MKLDDACSHRDVPHAHQARTVDPVLAQTPRFDALGDRFKSSVEFVGCDMGLP
jgi:hypothetical protein